MTKKNGDEEFCYDSFLTGNRKGDYFPSYSMGDAVFSSLTAKRPNVNRCVKQTTYIKKKERITEIEKITSKGKRYCTRIITSAEKPQDLCSPSVW